MRVVMRLLAVLVICASAFGAEIYVSPDGGDSGDGTKDRPLGSLEQARRQVRKLKAAGQKDIRVILRGGTYYVRNGLVLGPEDSGSDSVRITYAAAAGEVPVLAGGVKLGALKRWKGSTLQADIPAGVSTSQVFENGIRMVLARSPQSGYLGLEDAADGGGKLAFTYRAGDLDPADWNISGASVSIWPYHNWHNMTYRVLSIDAASRKIVLDTGSTRVSPGNRYFVQNVLALLDTAGECMIDQAAGKVYLQPFEGSGDKRYVVSTARNVIAVRGEREQIVRNVHFEGLDIGISQDDAVFFERAEDCSVRFCKLENAGGRGVALNGHAQRIVIYGNLIRYNGRDGVALYGPGPGRDDLNHHNVVENNHIHHCGRLVGHGAGVYITQSGHNRVVHNHIHHMGRWGTTIKGRPFHQLKKQVQGVTWENHFDFLHSRNNYLAFNEIHHVNMDSQDTGAMESWGPGRDNIYHNNLIHDTGNDQFDLQSGLYLDDATNYFTVTNNIIYGVRGTRGNQMIYTKGVGNRIENNIMVGNGKCTAGIRSFFMADERCDHHTYVRNIICFEGQVEPAVGRFDSIVGNLQGRGTTLTWEIEPSRGGTYQIWLRYAAANSPYGYDKLEGRYSLSIADGAESVLTGLPDTGGWGEQRWGHAGTLEVKAGSHRLVLTNNKGGGLNLDAVVLCSDKDWKPKGVQLDEPKAGELIVVQAEAFLLRDGVGGAYDIYDFDNWSADRVSEADYNVFWAGGSKLSVQGSPADKSLEKWRTLQGGRFDSHSVVGDPMFVDAAAHDYRLRADSPALKLGFKQIDTSQIGLRADFPSRFERR